MCELRLGVNYFYDDSNDRYDELRFAINRNFNTVVNNGGKLFTTNVEDLFDVFLNNLPEKARQFYNCNACKLFFNRFGGLVTIDDGGNIESALFYGVENTSKFFSKAVKAMRKAVLNARVNGLFFAEEQNLGLPVTGEHTHFYAQQPKNIIHKDRLKTPYQKMAEKKEDYKMLTRALLKFSEDVTDQALALLETNTMYRSDRVLGVAKFFKQVHVVRNSANNSRQKENLVWLAVAEAPTGFTHINSSMIGTLLEDIAEGLSMRVVSARFEEKMNPNNYMRSQSAPSANAIYEAEKKILQLGLENSLQRRYARKEEIPFLLWEGDKANKNNTVITPSTKVGGIFSSITPKGQATTKVANQELPTSVMTWAKFERTVLNTADKLEVLVDNPNRIMAMVTAVHPEAKNILQWDNPFSWYYQSGIDGDTKARVEANGGRYENNVMRASLIWDGYTDLDLHCYTPYEGHIYYSDKRGRYGYLDLDMNGIDKRSDKPVENMRWSDHVPNGRYKFVVNNFSEAGYNGGTPFKVELEIEGKIYHIEGQPLRHKQKITVFEFDYKQGQEPVFYVGGKTATQSFSDDWTVTPNSFVEVTAITESPNLWGSNPKPHIGSHVFFLLDGVQDTSGKGKGFINETLTAELREIRKVLEAYTNNTPIEGADEATACGVGFTTDNDWGLTLKVTSGNSSRLVKIDRFD